MRSAGRTARSLARTERTDRVHRVRRAQCSASGHAQDAAAQLFDVAGAGVYPSNSACRRQVRAEDGGAQLGDGAVVVGGRRLAVQQGRRHQRGARAQRREKVKQPPHLQTSSSRLRTRPKATIERNYRRAPPAGFPFAAILDVLVDVLRWSLRWRTAWRKASPNAEDRSAMRSAMRLWPTLASLLIRALAASALRPHTLLREAGAVALARPQQPCMLTEGLTTSFAITGAAASLHAASGIAEYVVTGRGSRARRRGRLSALLRGAPRGAARHAALGRRHARRRDASTSGALRQRACLWKRASRVRAPGRGEDLRGRQPVQPAAPRSARDDGDASRGGRIRHWRRNLRRGRAAVAATPALLARAVQFPLRSRRRRRGARRAVRRAPGLRRGLSSSSSGAVATPPPSQPVSFFPRPSRCAARAWVRSCTEKLGSSSRSSSGEV